MLQHYRNSGNRSNDYFKTAVLINIMFGVINDVSNVDTTTENSPETVLTVTSSHCSKKQKCSHAN